MEDEISLKEIIDVFLRQKLFIIIFIIISVLGALLYTVYTKPLYEGKTIILIRSSQQPSQISGFASMLGLSNLNLSGVGSSITDIDELLQTPQVERKVKEMMLNHPSVEAKNIDEIDIGKLKTKIKGSILTINVLHKNPVLAADIANAYASAVDYYWNKLNISETRKKIQYLEEQLPIAEAQLNKAQNKLKSMTLLVTPSPNLIAGQNTKTLDIIRLEKEFEIQASIYQMLKTEYASAQVQLAKEVSPFSDIELSKVPLKPSVPNKKLNLIVGLLIGIFGGVFFAFLIDYFQVAYSKTSKR